MQTDAYKQSSENLADAITHGVDTTIEGISNIVDSIKTKAALRTIARELTRTKEDRKSTGSYTIRFASGKTYSGKGPLQRARDSAVRESIVHQDVPVEIDWTPAPSRREAFKQEYVRIQKHGGPQGLDPEGSNYNIKQSPGAAYFYQDHGYLLPATQD